MEDRTCNNCDMIFDYPYLLNRHLSNKRGCKSFDKSYICDNCNNSYSNKQNLNRHYKQCSINNSTIIDNNDNIIYDNNTIVANIIANITTIINNNNIILKQLLSKQ